MKIRPEEAEFFRADERNDMKLKSRSSQFCKRA
jgi:hypothetical protein